MISFILNMSQDFLRPCFPRSFPICFLYALSIYIIYTHINGQGFWGLGGRLWPSPMPVPPPWGVQNGSQIDPKIDKKIDIILDSFWPPLGSLLASLLGPLGRRNRSKFGPRGPRFAPRGPKIAPRPAKMTIFVRKLKFQKVLKNLRKNTDSAPPNRLQIVPRWP